MRIRGERGQALVEFAVLLPLLVILVLAVIQFGIAFNNYIALTDASRAGARVGGSGRQLADPAGEAEAAVRKSADDLDQGQLDVLIASSFQPGAKLSVTASYPYTISLLGLVLKSGQLTSTTRERVE